MNKAIFLFAVGLVFAVNTLAQETSAVAVITVAPATARFEIVQPAFGNHGSQTLKLDKYTGQIFQLGSCPKDAKVGSARCWKEMEVIDLPRSRGESRPRFQLYLSGQLRTIFMLNLENGETWQLGADGIIDKWFPFLADVPLP